MEKASIVIGICLILSEPLILYKLTITIVFDEHAFK